MDILLPRRKQTWRDSIWWHATRQSLISGLMMMLLALPMVACFASQLMALSRFPFETRTMLTELVRGSLLMMPYLWAYFFVLERIAKRKDEDYSPHFNHR